MGVAQIYAEWDNLQGVELIGELVDDVLLKGLVDEVLLLVVTCFY
jgi:hypothetical protein